MGTVRRELRIDRSPDEVWAVVGDPTTIHEWFPGIDASTVEGDVRTITLGSGLPLPERIVTVDPLLRRFQYRIEGGIFRNHQGTIDVLDLGDGTSLVVYSTDAEPDVMALVIGGATGAALHELKRQLEDTI
jgi:carbon monoxide dehydrogenase subunit G